MDYQIVDIKGKSTGEKITLDKKVFGIDSHNHVSQGTQYYNYVR